MFLMHRRRFRQLVDAERVRAAIEAAEQQTSGEIRVSVATFFWGRVRPAAEHAFERLGMTATAERNGVLFFVVPSRRRFVVLGDEGIHARVGQDFWEELAAAMSAKFRAGDFTGGLVAGIEEAGRQLAEHFPHQGERDRNELADDVDFGER
jgi:uncharacterized membrane protein